MPPLTNRPFQDRDPHPLDKATVLQIIAGDAHTAASRAALGLVSALNAAGARALVACSHRLMGELQTAGGTFLPLPSSAKNPLAMALCVQRLVRLIETERAAIVHVGSRALAWAALAATRITKTPLVTSYGDGYDARNPVSARYNSVLARGDAVIAGSSFAAAMAAKHFPKAAGKIRVIRRGIERQIFSPGAVAPARVSAIREQWKTAPQEQLVLLLAPSLDGRTGGIMIEAVRLLAQYGLSGVKFVAASGNAGGLSGRSFAGAIAREGLQGIMLYAGEGDMPAALLAATLVAVLPKDGTPAIGEAAIKAQAMGTPVIAANVGAAREMVLAPPVVAEEERTGFLVPPGDAPALALAIARTLTLGASARARLSARAIAHVEQRHSAQSMYAQILEVYAGLRLRGDAAGSE